MLDIPSAVPVARVKSLASIESRSQTSVATTESDDYEPYPYHSALTCDQDDCPECPPSEPIDDDVDMSSDDGVEVVEKPAESAEAELSMQSLLSFSKMNSPPFRAS